MPCICEPPLISWADEITQIGLQRDYYKKKADQAARLLCSVLGELLEHDPTAKITDPELAQWWEEHKKFDEDRK